MVHPEHEAVAREVGGWFTTSAPEIGYEVSEHWYGYQSDLSPDEARVILRMDEPGRVPAALADARAAGESVAVLAYYRGSDQLVFNLGTRVPYRRQGIAQAMLERWADAGTASGCRSLIINATDGGRPAELYRRMGFADEIYWYQKYELAR
jgi:GNAT superfamily N-acetyltransferase